MEHTPKRTDGKAQRATDEQQPAKLSYWQIDRLARSLAFDLMGDQTATRTVMLLMDEIAKHPFDFSHVETIAHLVKSHLFGLTGEADQAFAELIKTERERFIAEGGAQ